ncbi:MAG: enoyl-CoA hydratase-related protein [Thermoplasmata archaeon]|nr:enoyl-CoA hydratase-related protein [Thermoplasmata archaeon]
MSVDSASAPEVVAVLGAGNMGSGIAQTFAQAGYRVRVRDVTEEMTKRGRALIEKTLDGAIQRKKLTESRKQEILARVEFTTSLADAVKGASLVVEAVFEEEEVKRRLFADLAPLVAPECVVVTNTSSLSVARLADGFPEPGRFGGLHFFFPAAVNRLVEVIGGPSTTPATLQRLEDACYRLKKVPIRVQDRAGFAVNRYFVPYLNEATRLHEEGVASLATIEEVGRELFGATLGPFELMNVTGVTIAHHSMGSLEAAFGRCYAPSKALTAQFQSGKPWAWKETAVDAAAKGAVKDRFLGLVFGIAARLVEEGVASPEATDRGATVGLRWAKGPFTLLSEVGPVEALAKVEAFAKPWGDDFPVSKELRTRAARGDKRWPLSCVKTEKRGHVTWVLMDRPESLNALNTDLLEQLRAAFTLLEHDASTRCVVLGSSSPSFCAGADIAEMAQKDPVEGRNFGMFAQSACRKISEFPHPVIAFVEGHALGGGLEIALACDFIVAADGAQLGLPEVTVGIHPGMGGASRLARLVGPGKAKMLVYTGIPVSAGEAARLGFVARVLFAASAREEAQAMAEAIAERAPLAVSWVKSVIDRSIDSPIDAAVRMEGESAGHTFSTWDRSEGMRAFLERRPPKFEGR